MQEFKDENIVDDSTEQAKEYTQESFLEALKQTETAYLAIVIISAVLVAAGIAVAVIVKVSYGLIFAMAAVLFYILAVKFMLRAKLGVSYTSVSGALYITKCDGKDRVETWIPRRLLWLDVRSVEDRAFGEEFCKSLQTVHLPSTLTHIGKDIFAGCPMLSRICFEGTKEQWESIDSETDTSGFEIEFCEEIAYPDKKAVRKAEKIAKKAEKAEKKKKIITTECENDELL